MRKLDLVTYDQALKLREIGFDEDTVHYYEFDGTLHENAIYIEGGGGHGETVTVSDVIDSGFNKNAAEEGVCDAPTVHQAIRWIYDRFGVAILPEAVYNKNSNELMYGFYMMKKYNEESMVGGMIEYSGIGFYDYETALLFGLNRFFEMYEDGDEKLLVF